MSLPDPRSITNTDVLAVIDARGGAAYIGSVETGLANRSPYAPAHERLLAIQRALASRVVVQTPLGLIRRPPADNE